jgi:hypothetical protein
MSNKVLEQYLATKGLRVVFVVNKYLICETVGCRFALSYELYKGKHDASMTTMTVIKASPISIFFF